MKKTLFLILLCTVRSNSCDNRSGRTTPVSRYASPSYSHNQELEEVTSHRSLSFSPEAGAADAQSPPPQSVHYRCLEDDVPGPNEYSGADYKPSHVGCEFSTTDWQEFLKHLAQPHQYRPRDRALVTCGICGKLTYYSLYPGCPTAAPCIPTPPQPRKPTAGELFVHLLYGRKTTSK